MKWHKRFKNLMMKSLNIENVLCHGRMSCVEVIQLTQTSFLRLFAIEIYQFFFSGNILSILPDSGKAVSRPLLQFIPCCLRVLLQVLATVLNDVLLSIKPPVNIINLDIVTDSRLGHAITLGVFLNCHSRVVLNSALSAHITLGSR